MKTKHKELLVVGVMMRVTPKERDRLKRCAAKEDRSVSNWLRTVVMQALEAHEQGERTTVPL